MKRLFLLVLVLLVAAPLCACSIPDDDPEDEFSSMYVAEVLPPSEFETLEALSEAAGFTVTPPQNLMSRDSAFPVFSLINDEVASVSFMTEETELADFRMAKKTGEDISGVADDYPDTANMTSPAAKLFSSEGIFHLATWDKGEYTYSVFVFEGTDKATLEAYVKNVK